uniref:Bestrophin homolog n=1 Tax=Heterorhabditis bacteriophora TaxID=37862 RepID=A0A1I7XJP7_HETBA
MPVSELVTYPVTLEKIAEHCDAKLNYIPLTFMLGFFVTIIVDRWRQIFNNMGWIENVALTIATLIRGDQDDVRKTRRAIIRYLVLSQILVFRDISMRVRRRFPNMDAIVKAGFVHENELKALDDINLIYNKYWAPINWALTLCTRMHCQGNLAAPPSLNTCLNEIKAFRTNLSLLCNFDWVPVPIAYPQIDLYVPFMTILQFIFFVGWMKVAEALLNPLGEDDDDFECNFLIDKNIATGLAIVDDTFDYCPELLPDRFSDPGFNPVYSEDSQKNGLDGALIGSAEGVKHRSHSIQPIHLSNTHPVALSNDPERPYSAFDLSNGFAASKFSHCSTVLDKVDEENNTSTISGSLKTTIDSVDEDENLITAKLDVDKKDPLSLTFCSVRHYIQEECSAYKKCLTECEKIRCTSRIGHAFPITQSLLPTRVRKEVSKNRISSEKRTYHRQ